MKFKKLLIKIFTLSLLVWIGMKFWDLKIKEFYIFGDQDYLNIDDVNINFAKYLRNQNIIFNDFKLFTEQVIKNNPEIDSISYELAGISEIFIHFKNKEICCVVVDQNRNKFLIDKSGIVIKKIDPRINYSLEIPIDQVYSLGLNVDLQTIEKINEVERLFTSKEKNFKEISIFDDRFEIILNDNILLLLDKNTSIADFWEKYQAITKHLAEEEKKYQILDFRFEKVIVK
jgi:hypothetical protein